jgi:hypothetical protein
MQIHLKWPAGQIPTSLLVLKNDRLKPVTLFERWRLQASKATSTTRHRTRKMVVDGNLWLNVTRKYGKKIISQNRSFVSSHFRASMMAIHYHPEELPILLSISTK